jgi:hypothetical protein
MSRPLLNTRKPSPTADVTSPTKDATSPSTGERPFAAMKPLSSMSDRFIRSAWRRSARGTRSPCTDDGFIAVSKPLLNTRKPWSTTDATSSFPQRTLD